MSRFCVIVEGQLRGSRRCGPNMRKHLIDPLGADLIIHAQHTPEYDTAECAERYGEAKDIRAYDNPTPDFSQIFDALRAEYGCDFDWRDTFKKIHSSNIHLGFDGPGTCIRRMYNRHRLYRQLQTADYDWYVLTRSDMYFLADFPINECPDPNLLYSANGGRCGGINNNLLVFGKPLLEKALNYITLFLNGAIAGLGNQDISSPHGMGEEEFFARAMALQNVQQADIRHIWFISADSTSELCTWRDSRVHQHPGGLLYKYRREFERAHQQARIPLPESPNRPDQPQSAEPPPAQPQPIEPQPAEPQRVVGSDRSDRSVQPPPAEPPPLEPPPAELQPVEPQPAQPQSAQPQHYRFHNGEKAALPFTDAEYEARLAGLRKIMQQAGAEVAVLTSMHNIAYYTGFLYCAFGRPYALVVTENTSVTISAGIDAGQPWRRCFGDNLTYTDWQRDNFWRAIVSVAGTGKVTGFEADHLNVLQREKLAHFLTPASTVDLHAPTMQQRMRKSPAEIALIREGARIADIGGYAIRDAVHVGAREIDIAMAGRNAMETAIAEAFPDAEYRDTWVWFQSGPNTDGAHNPVTGRKLLRGDILSLNAFPMICGYYTALERTMFAGEVDPASLKLWRANIAAHELGIGLLKPGMRCCDIAHRINDFFRERDLLQYRSFGYGHSFGVLSHYYGREAALELREDIDTVLEPGMVISMEPMLTLPAGRPGAGGYREHDILLITETGNENITHYPYGPDFNVVG